MAKLPVMEGNGPTPPKTIGRSPNFQCARSRLHFGARQAIDTIWNLQNRMSSHSKIAATADWAWPSWYFTSCVSPFHSCPFARIGRRTQRDSRLAGTRKSGNHQSLRRDQPPYETSGSGCLPAAYFRGHRDIPPKTYLARRRRATQVAQVDLNIMCPGSRAPPSKKGRCQGPGHIMWQGT